MRCIHYLLYNEYAIYENILILKKKTYKGFLQIIQILYT